MRRIVSKLLAVTVLLVASLPARAATTLPGIPNFHQVTEGLYRGGQPEPSAWKPLSDLGVKTVVDLRRRVEHSTTAESLAVVAAGMRYVNFPMHGFETPTSAQMASVLPLLDSDGVFVHCKQGRDRTGTVIAAYRISRQGWGNHQALDEARQRGLHWWNRGMKRFLAGYRSEPVVPAQGPGDAVLATSPVIDSTAAGSAAVGGR